MRVCALCVLAMLALSITASSIMIAFSSTSNYMTWFSKRKLDEFVIIQAFKYRRWPDRYTKVGAYGDVTLPIDKKFSRFWVSAKDSVIKRYSSSINVLINLYYFRNILSRSDVIPPIRSKIIELQKYYPLHEIYEPLNNGKPLGDGSVVTIPKGESVILVITPRLVYDYVSKYLSKISFEYDYSYPLSNYTLGKEVRRGYLGDYAALIPIYLRYMINQRTYYYKFVKKSLERLRKELPSLPYTLNPFSPDSSILLTYSIEGKSRAARVFVGHVSKEVPTSYFSTAEKLAGRTLKLRLESTVPVIQPSPRYDPIGEGSRGALIIKPSITHSEPIIVTINPDKFEGTFRIRFKAYIVPSFLETRLLGIARYGGDMGELSKYPALREFTITFKVGKEYWKILEGTRGYSQSKKNLRNSDEVEAKIVSYGYYGEAILMVRRYRLYDKVGGLVVVYQSLTYLLYDTRNLIKWRVESYFPLGGATPLPSGAPIIIKWPRIARYVAHRETFNDINMFSVKFGLTNCPLMIWFDLWKHPGCEEAYELVSTSNLWITYPLYQYKYFIVELTKFAELSLEPAYKSVMGFFWPAVLMPKDYVPLLASIYMKSTKGLFARYDYRVPPNWWGVLGVNKLGDRILKYSYTSTRYSYREGIIDADVMFSVMDLSSFRDIVVRYFGKYKTYTLFSRDRYVSPPPTYLYNIAEISIDGIIEGEEGRVSYRAGEFISDVKGKAQVAEFLIKELYVSTNKMYYRPGDEVHIAVTLRKGNEPMGSKSVTVTVFLEHKYLKKPKVLLTKTISVSSDLGEATLKLKLPTLKELSRDWGGKEAPAIIRVKVFARDNVNKLEYTTTRYIVVGAVFIELRDVPFTAIPTSSTPIINLEDPYMSKHMPEPLIRPSKGSTINMFNYRGTVELNIYDKDSGALLKNLKVANPWIVLRLPLGNYSAELVVKLRKTVASGDGRDVIILRSSLYNFTVDETIFFGAAPILTIDFPVSIILNTYYLNNLLPKFSFTDTNLYNEIVKFMKTLFGKTFPRADVLDEMGVIKDSVVKICSDLRREGIDLSNTYLCKNAFLDFFTNVLKPASERIKEILTVPTPLDNNLVNKFLEPYISGEVRLPKYEKGTITNPDTFWSKLVRISLLELSVIQRFNTAVSLIQKFAYGIEESVEELISMTKIARTWVKESPSIVIIDEESLNELVRGSGIIAESARALKNVYSEPLLSELLSNLGGSFSEARKELIKYIITELINFKINMLLSNNLTYHLLLKAGLLKDNNLVKLKDEIIKLSSIIIDRVIYSRITFKAGKHVLSEEAPPLVSLSDAKKFLIEESPKLVMKILAHLLTRYYVVKILQPAINELLKEYVANVLRGGNKIPTPVVVNYVRELLYFTHSVDENLKGLETVYGYAKNPLNTALKFLEGKFNYLIGGYSILNKAKIVRDAFNYIKQLKMKNVELMVKVKDKLTELMGRSSREVGSLINDLKDFGGAVTEASIDSLARVIIVLYVIKAIISGGLAYSSWFMGHPGTMLVLNEIGNIVRGTPSSTTTTELISKYANIFNYVLSMPPGYELSATPYFLRKINSDSIPSPLLGSYQSDGYFSTRVRILAKAITKLTNKEYLPHEAISNTSRSLTELYIATATLVKALKKLSLKGINVSLTDLSNIIVFMDSLTMLREYINSYMFSPNTNLSSGFIKRLTDRLARTSALLDYILRNVRYEKLNNPIVVVDAITSPVNVYSRLAKVVILMGYLSNEPLRVSISLKPIANIVKANVSKTVITLSKGLGIIALTSDVMVNNVHRDSLLKVMVIKGGKVLAASPIILEPEHTYKSILVNDIVIYHRIGSPRVKVTTDGVMIKNLSRGDIVIVLIPKRTGRLVIENLSGAILKRVTDMRKYYIISIIPQLDSEVLIHYKNTARTYLIDSSSGRVYLGKEELPKFNIKAINNGSLISPSLSSAEGIRKTWSTSIPSATQLHIPPPLIVVVILTVVVIVAIAYLKVFRRGVK